mmetsp:Transcript_512/g.539  ORF Transcript_512/g.539 Transcript_512/m.539 type:complete len:130 (-) Transcript_512:12-401(-)
MAAKHNKTCSLKHLHITSSFLRWSTEDIEGPHVGVRDKRSKYSHTDRTIKWNEEFSAIAVLGGNQRDEEDATAGLKISSRCPLVKWSNKRIQGGRARSTQTHLVILSASLSRSIRSPFIDGNVDSKLER